MKWNEIKNAVIISFSHQLANHAFFHFLLWNPPDNSLRREYEEERSKRAI